MYTEFAQAVQETVHDVISNIHTALPAKVVKYYNGRVDAQPVGKFYTRDGEMLDYPLITGCPICYAGSGNVNPCNPGDICVLIIMEQSLSEYLSGTQTHNNERWQLTNAIALLGLNKEAIAAQTAANANGTASTAGGMNVTGGMTADSGTVGGVSMSGGSMSATSVSAGSGTIGGVSLGGSGGGGSGGISASSATIGGVDIVVATDTEFDEMLDDVFGS